MFHRPTLPGRNGCNVRSILWAARNGTSRAEFATNVSDPPRTPDGRYIVVLGKSGARLWRASNPELPNVERQLWVNKLMNARRAVRDARNDPEALAEARAAVDTAKKALGERGPPWWDDGAPDLNRRLVRNTPYRDWWESTSRD